MKRLFVILLLLVPMAAWSAEQLPKIFSPLTSWLLEQGVPRRDVEQYFLKASFEAKLLAAMLSHKEVSRDYQGFMAADKIKRAQAFKNKYNHILSQTEKTTKVPAGVIVAILLIESDLGGYTGKTNTFNTLISQAVLDSAMARQALAKFWPARQKEYLASPAARERFARRASWAREEVLALMRLSRVWKISPLKINGSAAGALGWCQFMPSSIERWGADANGDHKVDLNNPLDAIASVARYLREHGWQENMAYEGQIEVLLTYNKSTPYAQAVLNVAGKL